MTTVNTRSRRGPSAADRRQRNYPRNSKTHRKNRTRSNFQRNQILKSANAHANSNSQSNGNTPGSFQRTSVFLGKNFTVSYNEWFSFNKLIHDTSACGVIRTTFRTLKDMENMELSVNAMRLLTVPNAGGSSVISEVLSFELLHRCFGAHLLKTEMEVAYFPTGGSITDYVCGLVGVKMGVSVTRAMRYHGNYRAEDAYKLLNKLEL